MIHSGTPPWGSGLPGNRWDLLDGVEASSDPLVSVVVVHFQQQEELDRTLLALQRQVFPSGRLEVIVVDDGSAKSPHVPPGIRLLVQEDRGFRASAARNRGAAAATGEILCFLDADTVPEPHYVAELTRLPSINPEVVTVGRRRHSDLDGADPSARIEEVACRSELSEPSWLQDGYIQSSDLLEADDRSYRFIISAVMACSRWFFDQVGGFDESFTEYGGEDWEWAYRAWLNGALLAHVPNAIAWHHGPDFSGRAMTDQQRAERTERETVRLAELIPAPGSRGRGLRWVHPDVVIILDDGVDESLSGTAGLMCLDAILADVPDAVAQVPTAVRALCPHDSRLVTSLDGPAITARISRARMCIRVFRPVRFTEAVLPRLIHRVAREDLYQLIIRGQAGEILFVVEQTRAARRMNRWADSSLFPSQDCHVDAVRSVAPGAGLAAYFGGW